jgi:hypothetical protein
MATRRGTTNSNRRGNASDRRARKLWLLTEYGDGVTAECSLAVSSDCPGTVTFETMSVDRIVPGIEGGTYARGNIRPACCPCNSLTGARLALARRAS